MASVKNTIGKVVEELKKSEEYQDEFRLKQDSLEDLYSQAYHFYESGHYESAEKSFTKLVISHPFDANYWFGLGATLQEEKKYERAIQAWVVSAIIDHQNPFPFFHAAECHFSRKEFEQGLEALNEAKKRNPEESLKEKIEALEDIWKKMR